MCVCVQCILLEVFCYVCVHCDGWFPCCCNWLTSCRKEAKEAREKVAEEERKREEARKVCVMLLTLSCRICDSELSHSLYFSRGVCQGGWADFLKPEGQQGLEACHVSSTICVGYTEVVYWNGVFVFIVVMVHRYWWFPYFFPLSFPLHFTPLFYCGTAEIFNDPELLQLFSVSQAEQCHMTIMWLTLLCVTTVCFKHWHTYLALYILHKLCTYVCVRTIFGVVYEL